MTRGRFVWELCNFAKLMKSISERAGVVVVGAGLSGLCRDDVSAARSGATVKLVEARHFLGGRIGGRSAFPL